MSELREPGTKEQLLKLSALVLIGVSALGACGTEAKSNSPAETQPAATATQEETPVSIAELDGSKQVPYKYSVVYSEKERHMVWGPGTPEEFKNIRTIEDLVGTKDEIAEKLKIPAGLSDEEFATAIIGSINCTNWLCRESKEEFNLLPLSFASEIIYTEGDYSDTKEVNHAFGEHFYDASEILFADDATEAAQEWRQLVFYNNAHNTILDGAVTDNKREGNTSDLEMFQAWDELERVVSSKEKPGGGRFITIRYRAFNNSNKNGIFTEPSGQTIIDYSQPKVDTDEPIQAAYHEITFATSITDDGREVINDVDDTFVE